MSVNKECIKCKSLCCNAGLSFSAVLTDFEKQQLKSNLKNKESTNNLCNKEFCYYDENAKAFKMYKHKDNRCVFWDSKTYSCTAYENRPLDCRIYPLEYRWFMWMHSPQCPARNFDKKALLKQLDDFSKYQVRQLKLMHLRTPESTKDVFWITLLKIIPIANIYEFFINLKKTKAQNKSSL